MELFFLPSRIRFHFNGFSLPVGQSAVTTHNIKNDNTERKKKVILLISEYSRTCKTNIYKKKKVMLEIYHRRWKLQCLKVMRSKTKIDDSRCYTLFRVTYKNVTVSPRERQHKRNLEQLYRTRPKRVENELR